MKETAARALAEPLGGDARNDRLSALHRRSPSRRGAEKGVGGTLGDAAWHALGQPEIADDPLCAANSTMKGLGQVVERGAGARDIVEHAGRASSTAQLLHSGIRVAEGRYLRCRLDVADTRARGETADTSGRVEHAAKSGRCLILGEAGYRFTLVDDRPCCFASLKSHTEPEEGNSLRRGA